MCLLGRGLDFDYLVHGCKFEMCCYVIKMNKMIHYKKTGYQNVQKIY